MEEFLQNSRVNKLNDTKAKQLEGLLNYQEVTYTLKNMNNDKSPGCDGFTANFYKVFWSKIGHFVVRCLNNAYINDSFSSNIKSGKITCLPKNNKPK